jgi:hypothetical protein
MMATKQDDILRLAEEEVQHWQGEVDALSRQMDELVDRMDDTQDKLKTATAFIQLLRERYGVRTGEERRSRFEGLALREAALAVIKENQRITPSDLLAELMAGGMRFGDHPARQLHAALIHQKQAARDPNGFWRWMTSEQPGLPMEEEVKEGN